MHPLRQWGLTDLVESRCKQVQRRQYPTVWSQVVLLHDILVIYLWHSLHDRIERHKKCQKQELIRGCSSAHRVPNVNISAVGHVHDRWIQVDKVPGGAFPSQMAVNALYQRGFSGAGHACVISRRSDHCCRVRACRVRLGSSHARFAWKASFCADL